MRVAGEMGKMVAKMHDAQVIRLEIRYNTVYYCCTKLSECPCREHVPCNLVGRVERLYKIRPSRVLGRVCRFWEVLFSRHSLRAAHSPISSDEHG